MSVKRLLLVDDSPVPWWQFWRADPWFEGYADLERADIVDNFDVALKVRHVEQAMRAIAAYAPHHVQVFTHGSPGRPLIGGAALVASDVRWGVVRDSVWFRACKVAQGAAGIKFMETLASQGVAVAAHLSNIGGLGHSNLVGVRAGARAFWKAKDKPKPGFDRFVLPTEMKLPAWAFEERAL